MSIGGVVRMATTITVTDIYNTVCECLMEPYQNGTYPGLSLGIVTLADFLDLFSQTLEDFVNRTGLVWSIFTQQVTGGTSQYLYPENLNSPKLAFLGGIYIEHSTLADLDDWSYSWQNSTGTPEYWHLDGLQPKTFELAVTPDYAGAGYVIPVDPLAQPPFGISGLFNGATIGRSTGTVSTVGTAVTWVSGSLFDTNWANYYPPLNITIGGTVYQVASVTDSQHLVITLSAGSQTAAFSLAVSNDANVTVVGTTGLRAITYALGDLIPVVPDSACFYLSYGVLARIFSTDGEAKDMQRSYYCLSRYNEGINALSAISGEMLSIDN